MNDARQTGSRASTAAGIEGDGTHNDISDAVTAGMVNRGTGSRLAAIGAAVSLIALIALAVAWEKWLAPLRPGGSALVFKALPLALAVPGVLRRRVYTFQWASMLSLLYFAEGVVRGMSDARVSAWLGWLQAALALTFLGFALAYVAPFKRAARASRQAKG
jgi:uncharacterized membrane protein